LLAAASPRRASSARIYGVVGDSLNGFNDGLRRLKSIEWIHVRHKEGAGFPPALRKIAARALKFCRLCGECRARDARPHTRAATSTAITLGTLLNADPLLARFGQRRTRNRIDVGEIPGYHSPNDEFANVIARRPPNDYASGLLIALLTFTCACTPLQLRRVRATWGHLSAALRVLCA
jgi:hypothetical protein